MKVFVAGETGAIGRPILNQLLANGHEAVAAAASRSSGVNAVTGEGLAEALVGAQVVIDVTSSPSFEDAAVLEFFETSTQNLLAAEADAGVAHHIVVSIVGADRIPDSGYMRAKVAQEKLIQSAAIPYTTVTLVFDHTLLNVPGKSIKVQTVEYEPGVSSIPHTHPDSAFIYATILDGAVRSKINDNPVQVYHAGESFFELPGDHHRVSANASDTKPVRLLAVLIANTDEQNLVINEE